jgi:hypothetical protein
VARPLPSAGSNESPAGISLWRAEVIDGNWHWSE